MLHDFISTNHGEIVSRTHAMVAARPCPPASTEELENGIPMFLDQLSETLRRETSRVPFSPGAIGSTAAMHGRELLGLGFTVSQVVHDYGDVCQAITGLAIEKKAVISSEEFRTLNYCLDDAIARSVTEHGRLKDMVAADDEVERLGRLAHEMRNALQTALLSFQVIKSGRVGIAGSTGAVLGRALIDLSEMIDSTLDEVRLSATTPRHYRVSLRVFVEEIAVAARLHAEHCGIRLVVEAIDPALDIAVDPQLLGSALTNLLQNAFKNTQTKGQVTIRGRTERGRVLIEVEDECGGVLQDADDLFRAFGDRKGSDRSGLGLGLSISKKAVTANGGEIRNRNLPGKGCIFTIDLPQASVASESDLGRVQGGSAPKRNQRVSMPS